MKLNTFTRFFIIVLCALFCSACATKGPKNPDDPYEAYNRAMFAFNQKVDDIVYTPVATVYDTLVPAPLQTGVTHFFNNLGEIPTTVNDLLQLNPGRAIAATWRLIINSTVGIGGLFDVAEHMGLKRNRQDLGQTFAKWGATKSAYFVIPFLGPSTVRDTIGLLAQYELFTVYPYIKSQPLRYGLLGLDFVDLKAQLLPTRDLIKQAFDPYVFVRDAYLQHRNQRIKSGGKEASDQDTYIEPEASATNANDEDTYIPPENSAEKKAKATS